MEGAGPPSWWRKFWLVRMGFDLLVWVSLASFVGGIYVGQRKRDADLAELRETQRRDTVMFTTMFQDARNALARIEGNQTGIVRNQVRGSSDMHILANQIRGDLRRLRHGR